VGRKRPINLRLGETSVITGDGKLLCAGVPQRILLCAPSSLFRGGWYRYTVDARLSIGMMNDDAEQTIYS